MHDLIVIGAGPAGITAASTAARNGLNVLVLDDQPSPGGQIFRNAGAKTGASDWLGRDYAAGAEMIERLSEAGIKTQFNARVWRLDAGPSVVWSQKGRSHISTARQVLLATGAQERPAPFPGWTLPGVMSAGAAQILMKSAHMVPKAAVLAGSGPVIYLIAAQMIDAGHPPSALVETQTAWSKVRALPHVPKALLALPTLAKGLGLIRKIRHAGVPRYTSASDFEACSSPDGSLEFTFTHKNRRRRLNCGLVLVHQGIIPATHISRSVGIAQEWNAAQNTYQPVVDNWGATNLRGFHITGDGAGIAGAEAASAAGELAALDILHRLAKITADTRNQMAASAQAKATRARAMRPLLDALYLPPPEVTAPRPETIVCRCEGITVSELQAAVADGVSGHRRAKTHLRIGMGPCQGRMCDATVQSILRAKQTDPNVNQLAPRARSPISPVTLGEIAALTNVVDPPA